MKNRTLLDRVNPIYNIAKMTLCGLAQAGDRDAGIISEKLGLTTGKSQDSTQDPLSAIQSQANAVFLEIRFRTMGALAENSDCRTIVDLPCGYTPRSLQTARKGRRNLGLDLPATVSEMESVIMPLCDDEQRSLLKYASVDATNYVSLETALEGESGPVCVTNHASHCGGTIQRGHE